MAILTPPAVFLLPSTVKMTPLANTRTSGPSPWNGAVQTVAMPGGRWAATLTWSGLTAAEWRALSAFIASLGGTAGRFTWYPPLPRQGTATNFTAQILGASQTGSVVNVTGFNDNGPAFLSGDLVGWLNTASRYQLHMVTADTPASPRTSINLQLQSADMTNAAFNLGAGTTDLGAVSPPFAGISVARRIRGGSTLANNLIQSGAYITATPFTTYSVTVWARLNTGGVGTGAFCTVNEYNSSSTFLTSNAGQPFSQVSGSWAAYGIQFTTGASTAKILPFYATGFPNLTEVDVAQPQIEVGTPSYFIPTVSTTVQRIQSISVPIWPPLRTSPNNGQPLYLYNAPGVFRLKSDSNPFEIGKGLIGNFSLDIEEALV